MSDRRRLLEEEGYFVVRGVLDPADISAAIERLRLVAGHINAYRALPNIHPVSVPELAAHPDPLYHFDWIDWITFKDEVLWRHVAAHPRLLAIARDVVGHEVFLLNGGGFFMKPPGSPKPVPWHQDASPFASDPVDGRTTTPALFDFWLALTDVTEEMGPLRLIPGSQHLGRVPHRESEGILHKHVDPADSGYAEEDVVTFTAGPGDLVVWHQDMIHGSETNRSDRSRLAVASIYHGRREEDELRRERRPGAIRVRPQFCRGEEILPCPDPIAPPWEPAA